MLYYEINHEGKRTIKAQRAFDFVQRVKQRINEHTTPNIAAYASRKNPILGSVVCEWRENWCCMKNVC